MVGESTTYVEILHCFRNATVYTLSLSSWQNILITRGLNLIQDYPYLLHAVIALAAYHMSFVTTRKLAAMGLLHLQQSLALYSKSLNHQVEERMEMDALLSTSFLLNSLFYVADEQIGLTGSWLTGPRELHKASQTPGSLHWPAMLSGPTKLLSRSRNLQGHNPASIYEPFARETIESARTIRSSSAPGDALLSLLHDICAEDKPPSQTYLSALNTLTPALKVHVDSHTAMFTGEFNPATYVSVVSFPSVLDSSFMKRLSKSEPGALLLVGFWFALLAKVEHCQWWCFNRAKKEGLVAVNRLNFLNQSSVKLSMAVSILNRLSNVL